MSGRIPETIIDEISRKTDIVELIGQHVQLKQQGSRYVGLCPFHNEKTPSFSVNQELGAYYCFGCHRKGTAFTFVMEIEGVTFPEAVRHLGERVGVTVESEPDSEAERDRKALSELYSRVSGSFAYLLHNSEGGEVALGILERRGIDATRIEKFSIGYAPADPRWLHRFLRSKGYSESFLTGCGLFTRNDPRRALYVDRIIFPIHDRYGNAVAFGGRLIHGDGPKYINSPESQIYHKRSMLYAHHLAREAMRMSRHAVIAEGYMDVIALHQAGVSAAVAPLGTAFTEEQARMLSRTVSRVSLLFDADDAGVEATRKAAQVLEAAELEVDVVALESGLDPADILTEKGGHALADAVSSVEPVLEYILRSSSTSAAETPEAAVNAVFPYVCSVVSSVKRDEALARIADYFGIRREAVQEDFGRFKSGRHRRQTPPPQERLSTSPKITAELYLLLATVANRDHFSYVRRSVQTEDLVEDTSRELYVALEECYRHGEQSLDALIARIQHEGLSELVRDRIATGEFDENTDQIVRDGVMHIRRRTLRRRRQQLNAALARLRSDRGESAVQIRTLIEEQSHIDRELQKLKGEG